MANASSFIIEFDLAKKVIQTADLKTFEIDPTDESKIYWIHCDRSQKGMLSYLRKKLNLSSDVIQVTKKSDRPSQILELEDTLTLQIECLLHKEMLPINESSHDNLVIHISTHYCFTISRGQIPIVDRVISNLPAAIQFAKTPCFVLFLIFDNLVAHYADIFYHYEIKAEDIDAKGGKAMYKDIIKLKKSLMDVRRHTIIVINILSYITSRDIMAISKHCRISLLTLLTNTQTISNESESIHELLNGTLGQIDNALMKEVNTTMRVLTAIAAIFMPPSLIAAIYGMNFQHIPELSWSYGYAFSLVLMLCSMLGMLYYFKRNKWF